MHIQVVHHLASCCKGVVLSRHQSVADNYELQIHKTLQNTRLFHILWTLGMHLMMYVVQILSLLEDLCLFRFHLGYKYFLVQCYSLGFLPPAGYKR